MKRQSKLLLSLLLAGCIFIGGCGAADAPEGNNASAGQNVDNAQEGGAGTDAADENGKNTDAAGENRESADGMGSTENADGAETDATEGSSKTAGKSGGEASSDGSTPAMGTEETQSAGPTSLITGIITDADRNYLSFQTPEGDSYSLTVPESGVTGNLLAVNIGQIVTLTYTGSLDENHAALTDISTSSLITGIYTEEYAFAVKIIEAVREMSIPKLRELINFPLFIDTGSYAGSMNDDVFRGMDSTQVFTEELVDRISNFNLFDLEYTYAGFVMGDGGPNITFSVDDDGILGIIGINCTKIPTSTVSANSAAKSSKSSK